jgi:hypothetical protein
MMTFIFTVVACYLVVGVLLFLIDDDFETDSVFFDDQYGPATVIFAWPYPLGRELCLALVQE